MVEDTPEVDVIYNTEKKGYAFITFVSDEQLRQDRDEDESIAYLTRALHALLEKMGDVMAGESVDHTVQ